MKSLGVCYWYIKMTQFEVVEHGLEYIMFNDQKHMAPLAVCSGFQLVCDQWLTFMILPYWTLRIKIQWNVNHNTKLFIHKNVSENIICEMVAYSLTSVQFTSLKFMPGLNTNWQYEKQHSCASSTFFSMETKHKCFCSEPKCTALN